MLAVAILALTVINASWLAPNPAGGPKLIALGAINQNFASAGFEQYTCTATQIEPPVHDYLENTVRSMRKAQLLGPQMVEMDIVATKDGQIAIFGDSVLDCRTDGSGDTRDFAMDELQALDIGYGYTSDGGASHPLRGRGVGQMPTLEQALAALPRTPILFTFTSDDPAEADLLARRLDAAGRDVERIGDGFHGPAEPVARIAAHYPEAWAFSTASARACSDAYRLRGWTGILPSACNGGTLIVPLDGQWAFWGWPNRLIARMEGNGGRVLVIGPQSDAEGAHDGATGLILPEQLTQIPASYNGYIQVEDIWTLGPALRPSQDRRSNLEAMAAQEGLDRRRARIASQ